MVRRRESTVAVAVTLALLVPFLVASSQVMASMGLDRPYDVDYVPQGRALKFLSPAIQLSIADAYWMATVQYIGERRRRPEAADKVFPLADLVTDLDPRHGYAYQTAGVSLSSAGRLDESDAILKKGIEKGPGWWSYPLYIAFNDFFFRGDYASAARWAELAARTPGASTNLSQLALSLKVKSGSPEDAVRLLSELRSTAKDGKAAEALDEQYRLALLQRDFRALDEAVARYRERHGRPPARLEALVEAGLLERIPEEPFGGRYVIHPDGSVHGTAKDFRFSPPEPPRPIPGAPPTPLRPPAP